MNNTFNPEDFDAAIQAKDYIKLKNYIINSIRNNPRFSHSKSEEASEATMAFRKLKDMKAELPGLFSAYKLQEGEMEFDEEQKDSWTQEYFIRQTFLLGENFCSKRFTNIRKIGQYLTKGNFNDPQEVIEGYEEYTSSVSNSTEAAKSVKCMPWLIIAILIAVVALLVGIMADLRWLLLFGIAMMIVSIIMVILRLVNRG